jgi:RNA polymerase sigma-70 factor (ECF subfamily)
VTGAEAGAGAEAEAGAGAEAEARFAEHRARVFAVAYRILGSATDAEDVAQETWLRWAGADRSAVAEPRAYLTRIAANLAVDRLRVQRARRETYFGPWLPEPILTEHDPATDADAAESVSMAMLVVLETLSPLERAVFVLDEVFAFSHAEIAAALDRSEVAVRQAAHRARGHVQARRPRFRPDPVSTRQATERFFAAAAGGDINALMELLAPDVTVWSDGGGKVRAARRPVQGARKVAAWLASWPRRPYEGVAFAEMAMRIAEINGSPSVLITGAGRVLGILTLQLDESGRVAAVRVVTNPDKLGGVAAGNVHPVRTDN